MLIFKIIKKYLSKIQKMKKLNKNIRFSSKKESAYSELFIFYKNCK